MNIRKMLFYAINGLKSQNSQLTLSTLHDKFSVTFWTKIKELLMGQTN